MAVYVTLEKVAPSGPDDGVVFVRDGFSLVAFLVPVLWLLWHRLWIEAAFLLTVTAALGAVGEIAGHPALGALLSLLVSLYAGLEAPALRVAALRRRGWTECGVIEADGLDNAEARYFLERQDGDDRPPAAGTSAQRPAPQDRGLTLGLLGYSGGR